MIEHAGCFCYTVVSIYQAMIGHNKFKLKIANKDKLVVVQKNLNSDADLIAGPPIMNDCNIETIITTNVFLEALKLERI